MEVYQIIYSISYKIYYILKQALYNDFAINLEDYYIVLPKWLPQIFKPLDIIVIGNDSYAYILATTLTQLIITILVWYLCISITYKALKKIFKLGFGTFGL